jgi:Ser/Thr protein kinase RdoA (MazF antagonist)
MHDKTHLLVVLNNWDIGEIASIEVIGDNRQDHKAPKVWKIKIQNNISYFLKTGLGVAGLQNELKIKELLNENKIPTALHVKTINGADFITEGEQWYVLYQTLIGDGVSEHFAGNYLERAAGYGRIAGYLHQGFLKCEPYVDVKESDVFQTVVTWAIPLIQSHIGLFQEGLLEEVITIYTENFKPLVSRLLKQLIHRDLHTRNMLFENGKLSGMLDFELSERNVRIFDPCYSATGILVEATDDPAKREQWIGIYHALITGYDEVAALSNDEIRGLWYVLLSIQFIFMAYFCSCNNIEIAVQNEKVLEWIFRNKHRIVNAPLSGT